MNKSGIKILVRARPINLLVVSSSNIYFKIINVLIGAAQKYLI
jgi:hypothetical protein